jgi:hypothetical protein
VFSAASDAAFADNQDRKSSEGYLFTLFGGPVDWKANAIINRRLDYLSKTSQSFVQSSNMLIYITIGSDKRPKRNDCYIIDWIPTADLPADGFTKINFKRVLRLIDIKDRIAGQ